MINHIKTSDDDLILQRADERRKAILNSATDVTVTGTSYYVSNSGNDSNNGLSPETAWATIDKVNSMDYQSGDGVFFRRGDVFRGAVQPNDKDNLTFSAYGEGAKPKIFGSPENGADTDKWILVNGTNNIWEFYKDIYDTSVIAFNDGSSWATRKVGIWDGQKYVEVLDNSHTLDPKELEDQHFLSNPDYTGYTTETANIQLGKKGKLYLRCDAGNPGSVYRSIEFACSPNSSGKWALVQVGNNCVVDNLCAMYGNQSGIVVVGSNSTVQNCEVAWVGGCLLCFNGTWAGFNSTILFRGGDGICPANGSGNSVINNYVHHINDSAITDELEGTLADDGLYVTNLTIKGNLTDKCSGGITISDWEALNTDDQSRVLYKNILIEDNYIMYSGYGWSHQEEEINSSNSAPGQINNGNCSLWFAFPDNTGENINVKDNVCYLCKYALVGGKQGATKALTKRYPVTFSGNTYVQDTFGLLTEWQPLDEPQLLHNYYFNINAGETVATVLGDKTAIVLPLMKTPYFGTVKYSTKSKNAKSVKVTIPVYDATVKSVSYTFTKNGSYTFTITSPAGLTASKTVTVKNIKK
jgi:hypothetical protein